MLARSQQFGGGLTPQLVGCRRDELRLDDGWMHELVVPFKELLICG